MRSLYILLLWAMTLPAVAQERPLAVTDTGTSASRLIFAQAESDYQAGRIEQAQELLTAHLNQFRGTVKQGAYRLLALCSLGLDDMEDTEKYALLLLKENPFYTSVQDPVRFVDIVNRLRIGKEATITTASSKAESLEEVPVPVTLITEQMIADCGADNLRDILAIFVPGMSIVEGNGEYNIAMHGIWSSRQEKILIMLNGHRLNARSTNAQAPDFSISCEKIKQIEVLRGPASSLYGNVALSAVVNIITKEGRDMDGVTISGKAGSFNTYKAEAMVGVNRVGFDVMAWASLYSSYGEKVEYAKSSNEIWQQFPKDSYLYLDGFNRKPSFDIGFVLGMDNNRWKIMSNIKHAKMQMVYPFTLIPEAAPYDYDRYRRIGGEKPGHGRTTLHSEVSYNNTFGEWTIGASAYFDMDDYVDYDILGDSIEKKVRILPPNEILDSIELTRGAYQHQKWSDFTYGGIVRISKDYELGKLGNGNLLIGFQGEQYKMYTSDLVIGDDYDRVLVYQAERTTMIHYGNETSLSNFIQIKHSFTPKWIMNIGFRYDNKNRYDNTNQSALSPRMAIIYKPSKWSFKLSYSKSFVDAPYLYRASTMPSYRGGSDLMPELSHALQLSVVSSRLLKHFTYDGNISYNSLTDLIYNDKLIDILPTYVNSGKLKLLSIENALYYRNTKLRGHLNFTYMNVISAENYPTTDHRVQSVPAFTANAVVAKSIYSDSDFSLWAQAKLTFYSAQTMETFGYKNGELFADNDYRLKESFLPDLSLEMKWKMISCKLQCKNLFNSRYYRGARFFVDIPQQGRNMSATIKVNL